MAEATTKKKTKAATTVEKKATASKKARASAKKRSSELEAKLGETKPKLVEAASLNTAQAEELADLKAALEAYKTNGITRGLLTLKNRQSPSYRKPGSWPLKRVDWLSCKL